MNDEKLKIMALIPARKGSRRIPGKNGRMLGGQPLFKWSIISALFNRQIGFVVVSSDCEDWLELAEAWGANGLLRPGKISGDSATDAEVIKHACLSFPADLIVYLRPTTPFRTDGMIKKAIETIIGAGESADSLRSVEEMGESCYKCFTLRPGPFLASFGEMERANLPNQEVPVTYRGNGYVDIVKISQVLSGDPWGKNCIAIITPKVVEIDTEDDFRYAEWWAANRLTKEEVVFK